MMRKIPVLLLLFASAGFVVRQPFAQEKALAQERRETDVPAEINRARAGLETAKQELERAGNEWGGHRVAAITHINQALAEIKKAEDYARAHKLTK
jgi:hypothetical protein